jgi:two-component system chemotaxis sensor kinase CheA
VLAPREVRAESVDGAPVAVLRDGEVAPMFRLDAALGEGSHAVPPADSEHVVLIETNDGTRALVVPRLVGRQEIVIKTLGPVFRAVRGIGGATVLGDGRVALILDTRSIFAEPS